MMAAGNGHLSATQALLAAGANIELTDQAGKTALMWAAYTGKFETLELLLSKGAKVDAHDLFGETAVTIAAGKGHDIVVERLQTGPGLRA